MEQETIEPLVLALDCASQQGSVALLKGPSVLAQSDDTWGNPSRAEELLGIVQRTIERADVQVRKVSLISVATGPGSYSGIRIGAATAAGFANAIGITWAGASLLDALSLQATVPGFVTAIPIGKSDIAWQEFVDAGRVGHGPRQNSEDVFESYLRTSGIAQVILPSALYHRQDTFVPAGIEALDAGMNLAILVGKFSLTHPARTSHMPIYLRNEGYSKAGF